MGRIVDGIVAPIRDLIEDAAEIDRLAKVLIWSQANERFGVDMPDNMVDDAWRRAGASERDRLRMHVKAILGAMADRDERPTAAPEPAPAPVGNPGRHPTGETGETGTTGATQQARNGGRG